MGDNVNSPSWPEGARTSQDAGSRNLIFIGYSLRDVFFAILCNGSETDRSLSRVFQENTKFQDCVTCSRVAVTAMTDGR